MKNYFASLALLLMVGAFGCRQPAPETADTAKAPYRILFDTDANNELDDQHALAYLLLQPELFEIAGVTTNATVSGGEIALHTAEAERIVHLCNRPDVKVTSGADGIYRDILPHIQDGAFDGKAAVDLIIQAAHAADERPLILVPVGKLTNIALALAKDPTIIPKVRIVWLGSNWPEPGEYNLDGDTTAVNPVLQTPGLDLRILTVRYGEATGTAAVTASVPEIRTKMAGKGPKVAPLEGRHGGQFTCFGDYSISLFENIGDPERALFDLCALSILKNDTWASAVKTPAPMLQGRAWGAAPSEAPEITFLENFNRDAILKDFYEVMEQR